ncbi:prenyltransferase/squalene oxidase repeat-containing protein [Amycolatopsis xylanica]|nr:prenyltransferase/squalene oxidase repeat-containing protein [Amycolatopsis xylanica]
MTWVREQASALVAEMTGDPFGSFSASVYETGRVVSLMPSLDGHDERVRYLLRQQRPDGGWGGPGLYGLAPTLSAVEALLRQPGEDARIAAQRGLESLVDNGMVPDTVAVEIIVPGLVQEINAQLGKALAVPGGMTVETLAKLREMMDRGLALPDKLLHSLEAFGSSARGAGFVEPTEYGVGCSPAATASWLGDGKAHPYLAAVQDPETRAVPVAAPLATFERAWVLSTLAGVGVPCTVPGDVVDWLAAEFGESGVAGGVGLPPDADDTAAALHALAKLGRPRSTDTLRGYRVEDHFATFADERTPSTTTNAHVLQALGASREGHREVMSKLALWLRDRQERDGSWQDKWHASPYYATVCCAVALAEHGDECTASSVRDAVGWVLANQRPDGSWGRWAGTFEETAYAVQILLRTNVSHEAIPEAAARGCAFLFQNQDAEHPPLWHDKDLYTPLRIVRAEGLAAMYLGLANAEVARLLAYSR